MLSTAQQALDVLAKHTGLGTLAFGTDKICSIEVGESLVVEIEDMPETRDLRLNAVVRVVGDADFSVLRQLLVANFNGNGTGKAALSINSASGEIVLTQPVEILKHTPESFVAEIEAFIRRALFWQEYSETLRPRATEEQAAQADSSLITLRL